VEAFALANRFRETVSKETVSVGWRRGQPCAHLNRTPASQGFTRRQSADLED
jgi:hypothetical protein